MLFTGRAQSSRNKEKVFTKFFSWQISDSIETKNRARIFPELSSRSTAYLFSKEFAFICNWRVIRSQSLSLSLSLSLCWCYLFYLTFVMQTWSQCSPCLPGDSVAAGQHCLAEEEEGGREPRSWRWGGGWWSRWSWGPARTSSSGQTPRRKRQYQADCLKRIVSTLIFDFRKAKYRSYLGEIIFPRKLIKWIMKITRLGEEREIITHLVRSRVSEPRQGRGCCKLARTDSCRPHPRWRRWRSERCRPSPPSRHCWGPRRQQRRRCHHL